MRCGGAAARDWPMHVCAHARTHGPGLLPPPTRKARRPPLSCRRAAAALPQAPPNRKLENGQAYYGRADTAMG